MFGSLIVAFAIGLLILCFLKAIFAWPLKILWWGIYNSIIGGLMLYLVNIFGIIHINITFWKALFAGVLGIPGVVIIIILHLL